MKKDKLKTIMEDSLVKAKELLLRDGKLVTVAFIWHKNNIDIIGLTYTDNKEKYEQLIHLKKLVKEKKADAVYIISESWIVTTKTLDLTIEPSKHPMRKEAILITGECEEGTFTIVQMFDRRNEEIMFGEKEFIDNICSLKFDFGLRRKTTKNKRMKEE